MEPVAADARGQRVALDDAAEDEQPAFPAHAPSSPIAATNNWRMAGSPARALAPSASATTGTSRQPRTRRPSARHACSVIDSQRSRSDGSCGQHRHAHAVRAGRGQRRRRRRRGENRPGPGGGCRRRRRCRARLRTRRGDRDSRAPRSPDSTTDVCAAAGDARRRTPPRRHRAPAQGPNRPRMRERCVVNSPIPARVAAMRDVQAPMAHCRARRAPAGPYSSQPASPLGVGATRTLWSTPRR